MAKTKDINDPKAVTEYIKKLQPAQSKIVEEIRQIILDTDSMIGEQIKWNAPSFFYTGEMKPFDPKEYKRDIAVFNLRKSILLIFPTGAVIKDATGVLEGDYTDGRRMVTFKDIEDVKRKKNDLQKVIKEWLKLVDK